MWCRISLLCFLVVSVYLNMRPAHDPCFLFDEFSTLIDFMNGGGSLAFVTLAIQFMFSLGTNQVYLATAQLGRKYKQ